VVDGCDIRGIVQNWQPAYQDCDGRGALPHLHSSAPALFAYATFLPRFTFAPVDVRFGSKADIVVVLIYVRFTPESRHWLSAAGFRFVP
jgi:hypothetical protein